MYITHYIKKVMSSPTDYFVTSYPKTDGSGGIFPDQSLSPGDTDRL